jgi:hypothetical protein
VTIANTGPHEVRSRHAICRARRRYHCFAPVRRTNMLITPMAGIIGLKSKRAAK